MTIPSSQALPGATFTSVEEFDRLKIAEIWNTGALTVRCEVVKLIGWMYTHLMLPPSALLLLISAAQEPSVDNWPSFRGPNGSGTVAATGLPEELDVDRNAVWRVEVPSGYSSPIVVEGRVVCTGTRDGACETFCFDALTGEPLWTVEAPEPIHEWAEGMNSRTSPTPASDGRRLFVLFPTFGMVTYDLEGEELWRRPMEDFAVPYGMSSSPMPMQGMVVLQCDQDVGSHLLALDGRTGETVWNVQRPGITHSYASPVEHFPGTGGGVVVTNGSFGVLAYSLKDGKELWRLGGLGWSATNLPLVTHGVMYICSNAPPLREFGVPPLSGTWQEALATRDADGDESLTPSEWGDPAMERLWFYFDLDDDGSMSSAEFAHALRRQSAKHRLIAIELGEDRDVMEPHVRWTYDDRRGLPDLSSPVLVEGMLFLVKDGGIVTSIRASNGEVLKQDRGGGPGRYVASPVAADGKLYLASGAGLLTVLSARAEWEVLGRSNLDEDVWATPAIACGGVYVRSQDALYCFRDGD